MTRLTRWVLDHKPLVVVLWIVLAVAGVAAAGPADRSFEQQFTLPGQEASVANARIVDAYGSGGDAAPLVPVVALPAGRTVDSPGVREDLGKAMDALSKAVPGARVASYASTGDRGFVSSDGRTTFALMYIPGKGGIDPGQGEARAAQAAVDGVSVGGGAAEGSSLALEALIAGGGALLVLGFVFASWMAFVPLLMAAVAIPTTFLAVYPLAAATQVSVIVKVLIALVGLAIAIDY